MKPIRSTHAVIVAIAAVSIAIAATTYAIAAIPGSGGVIVGCYSKAAGDLRVVSAAKDCKKSEKALTWNQKGQPGGRGLRGTPGKPGNPGNDAGGTILAATSGSPSSLSIAATFTTGGVALPPEGMGSVDNFPEDGTDLDAFSLNPNPTEVFPRAGTLTGVAASLTLTQTSTSISQTGVTAQLYASTAGGNSLTPVVGAACTMQVPASAAAGTAVSCQLAALTDTIQAGETGLIVFSGNAGAGVANIIGTFAASLTVGSAS